MDFYSIPIIINDRREKIINLYAQEDEIKLFKYIAEAPKNGYFHILEFSSNTQLKSFIPNTKDISLDACQIEFILNANTLQIAINTQERISKPEPSVSPTEEEPPIKAPILSYEDLELFSEAPKKHKTPIAEKPTQPTATSQVIGIWHNTVRLIAHHYSNGAWVITGYVVANYDGILDPNFPDLSLQISLTTEGNTYANATTLSIAHPEQFLGIALDFGSEASQMAIKRYKMGDLHQHQRPEIENLFRNILAYNKSKSWIDANDNVQYYQEEKNTNFYKSIFFLKSNLSGKYENIYKDVFVAEEKDNLKMLVNTYDGYQVLTEKKFHQLPNLKITQKYDNLFTNINFNIHKEGYDINVGLGTMKNKVYNSILKVMIASYLKKEFLIVDNVTRKVRFILLVPNIYDYYDIKSTQKILHDIFESLAETEYKGKLLSWEIMTISESDASFLGYINKNDINIEKNKDYIVIDSGKGTTDLSIIKTGKQNVYNIKPVFRNGFAGAGNLITFAVFETIIHYIRAHAKNQNEAFKFIKEKLINVLNSNDLEVKNKIFEQIERLKFKYSENQALVLNQWSGASVGDTNFSNLTEEGRADITSTFWNLISGIENISDFYGYINETCKVIASRTIQNIKLVKKNAEHFDCGGIILSGRAFLFKPLETIMRSMIEEELHLPASKIHLLNGNELKDICIKGVFNNSVRINSEKIGYPIQVIAHQAPATPSSESAATAPTKPKKTIQSRLLKMFFNELSDLENIEAVIPNSTTELQFESLYKSQFLIGGKRYKIIGNTIYNTHTGLNESASILFTEKGYLVRKMDDNIVTNVMELQEIFDTEDVELKMVIPSLFPNYIDEDFINTFQKTIDLQPQHSSPIYFDFNASAKKPDTDNNNTPPKGPIYF